MHPDPAEACGPRASDSSWACGLVRLLGLEQGGGEGSEAPQGTGLTADHRSGQHQDPEGLPGKNPEGPTPRDRPPETALRGMIPMVTSLVENDLWKRYFFITVTIIKRLF